MLNQKARSGPDILKNKGLEVQFDLPEEGYSFSRFDWVGEIIQLMRQDIINVQNILRVSTIQKNYLLR